MAYPRYITKSAFASGTGALTVGALTSTQAGDIIILFVESANQTISTPTDYSVLATQVGTGTAGAAGGVRIATFYRILGDTADTSTTVADSGDHTTAIKMLFRDTALLDGSFYVTATSTQGTASTAMTFPAVTTATDESLVVLAVALDTDAASTATVGAVTNANLANITERHDETVIAGAGGGLAVITGEKATAGSTGTSTATGSTSVTRAYTTISLSRISAQTTTSSFNTVSNTTYVPISDALRITADSSGKVTAVASGSFQPNTLTNGTYALNFKWYYRQLGTDTWTASAAQASTTSALVSAGVLDTIGQFSDTENVTGLTNGVEYEFVLFATRTSATPTNTISFSATATIAIPKIIIADGTTYSYTGTAANTLFNRKVVADGTTYSYTGTAANTLFNRKVIADGTTFSYTGGAANLYDNKLVTAESGTITYSGIDANLVYNRRIIADGSTYSYSGQDANTLYKRIITADSGTFSYAGNDAALLASLKITADSGTFLYSVSDATLTATTSNNYILTADTGIYTYAGTVLDFVLGRVLVADSATYSYSGTDVNLLVGYKVAADSVNYSLSGQAATFALARLLTADSAIYSYAGTNNNLVYGRGITAGNGSFSYSLASADLTFESGISKAYLGNVKLTDIRLGTFKIYEAYLGNVQFWGRARPANLITAEPTIFTHVGTAASFYRGYKLAPNSRAFTFTGGAATLKYGRYIGADGSIYSVTYPAVLFNSLIASGFSYSEDNIGAGTQIASLQLISDGTAAYSTGAAPNWWTRTVAGIGSSYWAELVPVSGIGSMSGSALSTRIQISGNPEWILTRATLGVSTRTFTLNIYDAASGGNLKTTGTVSLSAERV